MSGISPSFAEFSQQTGGDIGPLTFQKWHASGVGQTSGDGQTGRSFQNGSSVLRGVEPGVLSELDELAGSVARVSQEKFTVLFVAEFDDALSLQEVR